MLRREFMVDLMVSHFQIRHFVPIKSSKSHLQNQLKVCTQTLQQMLLSLTT
jgi:hypothetical protein